MNQSCDNFDKFNVKVVTFIGRVFLEKSGLAQNKHKR